LNPLDFQAELEKRTAEEKQKMDEFKAHEEKMKAYQEAKRRGSKPPLASQNSNVPSATAPNPTTLKNPRGNKTHLQKNNKMVNKRASSKDVQQIANASSKSTTANTNEENQNPDSDDQNEAAMPNINMPFIMENETGEKGADPESNILLETEQTLIKQK
jgi:hypothetical protein